MSAAGSDVIVVGAGVVGLCSAWYLKQAGARVTVLSRDPLGQGASAGNAGMIVPSHVVPLAAPGAIAQGIRYLFSRKSPFFIKPRLDPDLMRWLWRFLGSCTEAHTLYAAPALRDQSLASVELFDRLQEEIGDFAWRQLGLLVLFHSEKYRLESLRAAELAESLGLRVRRLDALQSREMEPSIQSAVLGSVLYEDDGCLDPGLLLGRLKDALLAAGVEVRQGASVQAVSPRARGSGVEVVLDDRDAMHADTIVVAAGAWTGRLLARLGTRLPIQPAKGYSLTFPAPEGGPRLPMILAEEKVTVTPLPGRLRFAGTLALAGFDASIDERRLGPIREQALRYLPPGHLAAAGEAIAPWSGFRPASPDGLPAVGPLKEHPSVMVATGHGMIGLTLGPVTGRLVADLVSGATPVVDPEPLDPNRF